MTTRNTYILDRIQAGIKEYQIPNHMIDGLLLYIEKGIEPGSFLYAVLTNDLKGAFFTADHINIEKISNWVAFCVSILPSSCWGSRERVAHWMYASGLSNLNDLNQEMSNQNETT